MPQTPREWSDGEAAARYGAALLVWTLGTVAVLTAVHTPWGWIIGLEAAFLASAIILIATSKDLETGRQIASWGALVGTIIIPIAMGWMAYQSQQEAAVAEIVAHDSEIAALHAQQVASENKKTVLGADDAALTVEAAKQEAASVAAAKLADDIRASNGTDVQAWNQSQRQAMLAPEPKGLIGWAKQKIGIEDGAPTDGAHRSFVEDLDSVAWWQAGFFLVFIVLGFGGIATWLVVTSFINTIFGKGVERPEKGLKGWAFVGAWSWYVFERFLVRWVGKFAAVALVIYAIVGTRGWYFPDHPMPNSVLFVAAASHNNASDNTTVHVVGKVTVTDNRTATTHGGNRSLHDFKCSLPGAKQQYASCR